MLPSWQIVRELPPGFGGVERVAHELARINASNPRTTVFYLEKASTGFDSLNADYTRTHIPSLRFSRLFLPLPSRQLLRLLLSRTSLHIHLPCPTILAIGLLARIFRPFRPISIHWHSFLLSRTSPYGILIDLYQTLALLSLHLFSRVVVTSPVLRQSLIDCGINSTQIDILPCCLPSETEGKLLTLVPEPHESFSITYIGRLNSYKRVDWLIEDLNTASEHLRNLAIALKLHIVGAGPNLHALQSQARLYPHIDIIFHGLVSEAQKLSVLKTTDIFVLPSDSCNEAFGISQLEAMCAGVPAFSLAHKRSGSAWVSSLSCISWTGRRKDLPGLFVQLASNSNLLTRARAEARQRYLTNFARLVWLRQLRGVFGQSNNGYPF